MCVHISLECMYAFLSKMFLVSISFVPAPHHTAHHHDMISVLHCSPATPVAVHNGFHDSTRSLSVDLSSMDSSSVTKR